jgi:hypothetical protein
VRAGHAGEHIAREEASFAAFLDSDDAPTLSEPSGIEGVWQPATYDTRTLGAVSGAGWGSVAEQEPNDGADVVALLAGNGNLDEAFAHIDEPASHDDLAALRKALFGDGTDDTAPPVAWDNVLNFIPGYLQSATATTAGADDELSLHLGTGNSDEAWQAWVGQWSRVLTSYQDEVWGDLGALVEEARREVQRIETAKPDEKPAEPTALLRLRAILGHLRGSQ